MRRDSVFSRVSLFVCLSVCVSAVLSFLKALTYKVQFCRSKSSFGIIQVHLQNSRFVFRGHRLKVKVTGAKTYACTQALNGECPDLKSLFWYAGTSSGYLGQVHVLTSWCQGQGHRSKKRSRVVSLRLQGNLASDCIACIPVSYTHLTLPTILRV